MPSVDRSCFATAGVVTDRWLGRVLAQLAAEIGHGVEVGHAPAIDPPEDLSAVKAWDTRGREMLFDLVELELGRVERTAVVMGRSRPIGNLTLYNARFRGVVARFCLELHAAAWYYPFLLIAFKSFQIKHLRSLRLRDT